MDVTINEVLTETYSILADGLHKLLDLPVPLEKGLVLTLHKDVRYEDAIKVNKVQQEYLLALIEDLAQDIDYTKRELDKAYERTVREIVEERYPYQSSPKFHYQEPLKALYTDYVDVELDGDLLKAVLLIYTLAHEVASVYYFGDVRGINTLHLDNVRMTYKVDEILTGIVKKRAHEMAVSKLETAPEYLTDEEYVVIKEETKAYISNIRAMDKDRLRDVFPELQDMLKETALNISKRTHYRLYQRALHMIPYEEASDLLDTLKDELSAIVPLGWLKRIENVQVSRLKSIPPLYELECLYSEIAQVAFEVVADPPTPGEKLIDRPSTELEFLRSAYGSIHIQDNESYFKHTSYDTNSDVEIDRIVEFTKWAHCAEAEAFGIFNMNHNYYTNLTIANVLHTYLMGEEEMEFNLKNHLAAFVPAMNLQVYIKDM